MKLHVLHEAEEFAPKKSHERTVTSLARRMVARAIRDFHGKDELPAAKKMARNFHQRLVAAIEEEYGNEETEDVSEKEGDTKFSLTETVEKKTRSNNSL